MADKIQRNSDQFCNNGKNLISCETRYGKIKMELERHYSAVDEMSERSVGYKLLAAYSMFGESQSFEE